MPGSFAPRAHVPAALSGVAAILIASALASTAYADGDAACLRAARAWATRCAEAEHVGVAPRTCGGGRATFRVEAEGALLGVEVTNGPEAFRRVGAFGVSPIGEFADWNGAPRPVVHGFDAVVRCAARGVDAGMLADATSDAAPEPARMTPNRPADAPRRPEPHVPWRLVLGVAAVLALAASRLRRRTLATAGALAALGLLTLAARRALLPEAFFHQNGHGALWIEYALGIPCEYGSGYFDVFGWAARHHPFAADDAVFAVQACLGATVPISLWILARASGASRPVAWAAALMAAMDPGLARLASSESYYGVMACLLLAASATLASGARSCRFRTCGFAASILGASAFLTQALLVHPVSWLPAAFAPSVVLVGTGPPRRRIRLAAGTLGIIGLFVALSVGPALLGTYAGQRRWGGHFAQVAKQHLPVLVALLVAALLLLAAASAARPWMRRASSAPIASWTPSSVARIRRAALAAGMMLGIVAIAAAFDGLSSIAPRIGRAYWALWLGPIAAAGVAALSAIARTRRASLVAAALLVCVGVANAVRGASIATKLPTDATEANLARTWRSSLPEGAHVAYVGRAGPRIAELPVYRASGAPRVDVARLDASEPEGAVGLYAGPDAFYYRSSLCSTKEGASFCRELEQHLDLEPVMTRTLMAIPSGQSFGYDAAFVEIGLYRIRGSAP